MSNCQLIFNSNQLNFINEKTDPIFLFPKEFLEYKKKKFFITDFISVKDHENIENTIFSILENKIKSEKNSFNFLNNKKIWIYRILRDTNILQKIIKNLKKKYQNIYWISQKIEISNKLNELSDIKKLMIFVFNESSIISKINKPIKDTKKVNHNFNFIKKFIIIKKIIFAKKTKKQKIKKILIGTNEDYWKAKEYLERFFVNKEKILLLTDSIKKKPYNFEIKNSLNHLQFQTEQLKENLHLNYFDLFTNFINLLKITKQNHKNCINFIKKNIKDKNLKNNLEKYLKNKNEITLNFLIYKSIVKYIKINNPNYVFVINNDGIYERILEKLYFKKFILYSIPHGFMPGKENYDYYCSGHFSNTKIRSFFLKKQFNIKNIIYLPNKSFIKIKNIINIRNITIVYNGLDNTLSNYYYSSKFEENFNKLFIFIKNNPDISFFIRSHPKRNNDKYLKKKATEFKIKNINFLKKKNSILFLKNSDLIIEMGQPSAATLYCIEQNLPIVLMSAFLKKISSLRKYIIFKSNLINFRVIDDLFLFIKKNKYHFYDINKIRISVKNSRKKII